MQVITYYSLQAKKLYDLGKKALKQTNQNAESSQQRAEKAYSYFTDAINKDPNHALSFQGRGQCYILLGDFQRALYDFTMAIKLDATNGAEPDQQA